MRWLSYLITLLWCGSLWALPEIGFTAAEKKTIESGGVAVRLDKSAGATEGLILICGYVNAPPEKVWAIITDYPNFQRLYPELLIHKVLNRTAETEDHYALFDYPWPLEDRWILTRVVHEKSKWYIHWTRIAGTVKEGTGSWTLYPEGTRTLVVYRVHADPGLKFVPDWFVQWGTRVMAPKVILRVRQFARN